MIEAKKKAAVASSDYLKYPSFLGYLIVLAACQRFHFIVLEQTATFYYGNVSVWQGECEVGGF